MVDYEQLKDLKASSIRLRSADSETKNNILNEVADSIISQMPTILNANAKDVELVKQKGLSSSMIDRLLLTQERLKNMASAVNHVAQLNDPVGEVVDKFTREDGLSIIRERTPLGVIFMIYESRPNVTIDAASLAFKAGNAILLRGGSESIHTNRVLMDIWNAVLSKHSFNHAVSMVQNQSHALVSELLQQDEWIDLVIPRGGENLIKKVVEQSTIPVLKHYKGVCHCFVDESAEIEKAIDIVVDGKLSRPGVCNALETLLVHKNVANEFWQKLEQLSKEQQLELRACKSSREKLPNSIAAKKNDFGEEFLAKILAVKQVDSLYDAIEHIQTFGSKHTEVIVSKSREHLTYFKSQVDASVIMLNCSSRFSDGGELGLGAEIGISTSKLHAYGPMGLEALTIPRFIVQGDGLVRHTAYSTYQQ